MIKYFANNCLHCNTPSKSMQMFFCFDCSERVDQERKTRYIKQHKEIIDEKDWNKIEEYKKIVDDAKIELEKIGVVKNYDTANKCENLNRLIGKYQQLIVIELKGDK